MVGEWSSGSLINILKGCNISGIGERREDKENNGKSKEGKKGEGEDSRRGNRSGKMSFFFLFFSSLPFLHLRI